MTGPIDPKKIARWQEWEEGEDIDPYIAVDAVRALLAEREELVRERERDRYHVAEAKAAAERDEQASLAATMSEIAKANAERARLGDEMLAEERAERKEMLALLREVEWKGGTSDGFCAGVDPCCPVCGASAALGAPDHDADCRLAAFLGRG